MSRSAGLRHRYTLCMSSGKRVVVKRSVTAFTSVCAAVALLCLTACFGESPQPGQQTTAEPVQTGPQKKPVHAGSGGGKKTAKPEASQQELADYVRGQLIALSPGDGINDNQEVSFDPATSVLSITQADGRCDIFLGAIDGNTSLWEVYDPSESYHTRAPLLRLTLTSLTGKKARTCYDSHGQADTSISGNRARLLFSQAKAAEVPDFPATMSKAIKKLIVLAGGNPEKKLFQ